MANVGEKRPAPDSETSADESGGSNNDDRLQATPAKRPALSGFIFRPSPLQQATQGFSLKKPILSASTATNTGSGAKASESSTPTPLHGGFLKLDSSELKPIATATTLAPVRPSAGFSSFGNSTGASRLEENDGGSDPVNHGENHGNLFLQFLNRTSTINTFSSSSSPHTSFTSQTTLVTSSNGSSVNAAAAVAVAVNNSEDSNQSDLPNSEVDLPEPSSSDEASSGVDAAGMPLGFQSASAVLPDVQIVTGEEKERKIVQVPGRLYVFDVTTHTWKERGYGEVRLNDSARSEGVFQSRLVMRTLGSYRLLLNTHLWAHMKCERASQKGIRITAQYGDEGKIGVFLVMGATKDIQQLFTAIDRRIEALRRNSSSDSAERDALSDSAAQPLPQFDDDDKESSLGEQNSSPESSPECNVSSRTRHAPAINIPPGPEKKDSESESKEESETETREVHKDGIGKAQGAELSTPSSTALEERRESDKESETTTPPSSRSPSEGASTTTTISSSTDNATEANFSQ